MNRRTGPFLLGLLGHSDSALSWFISIFAFANLCTIKDSCGSAANDPHGGIYCMCFDSAWHMVKRSSRFKLRNEPGLGHFSGKCMSGICWWYGKSFEDDSLLSMDLYMCWIVCNEWDHRKSTAREVGSITRTQHCYDYKDTKSTSQ